MVTVPPMIILPMSKSRHESDFSNEKAINYVIFVTLKAVCSTLLCCGSPFAFPLLKSLPHVEVFPHLKTLKPVRRSNAGSAYNATSSNRSSSSSSSSSHFTLMPAVSLLPGQILFPNSFNRIQSLKPVCFGRKRCRLRCVRAAVRVKGREEDKDGTALLWFKQDLRTDDHPGLVHAAAKHRNVVPVYVFDRRILSGYSDEVLKLLISALDGLKRSLKHQGSDLLIGFGNVEIVIPKLVNEVKATHIFVEEDVEYCLRRMISLVKASLSASPSSWGSPEFIYWRTPFYHFENLMELPESYNEFENMQVPLTSPLACPVLPELMMELDRGAIPTYDEIKQYLHETPRESGENLISLKEISAKASLQKKQLHKAKMLTFRFIGLDDYFRMTENLLVTGGYNKRKLKNSFFVSEMGNVVRGGTDVALNALSAYLRYLEGTARDDWQELHEKLRISETRRGASFDALFRCALCLGLLSRRRIYYETIKYEKERNAGFISPFGYSTITVAAAVNAVRSMEWYWLLNLKQQILNEGRFHIRVWRWKGYLVQYTVAGREGPAVLLVHGFGGFLDHYRGNISAIADVGHRVWAITLLGFGKSEKPNIVYNELMWAELLRDFIVDVVGEPVHIVGNSIGGYFSATVAGLWPSLTKSLVLVNTAGPIVPGSSVIEISNGGQMSGFAAIGARLLLEYLRLRIRYIVKEYYPTIPERVDDFLINEMLRASYDPGVMTVLESVFNFKLPIPLNYLLDSFEGRTLIIEGTRDPLSKSETRISMFKEHCKGITIKELDAGHCPQDEVPELVNSIITQWTASLEDSLLPV